MAVDADCRSRVKNPLKLRRFRSHLCDGGGAARHMMTDGVWAGREKTATTILLDPVLRRGDRI